MKNLTRTVATLCLCFCISALSAQDEPVENHGFLSFGFTMPDYNFQNHFKYNTTSHASFGVQLAYWQPVVPHIYISGNLGIDLSHFPTWFLKGDSTGRSDISLHAEALVHLKAFARNVRVNPFITAGIGGGAFGFQQAIYAPLGAGIDLRVNEGSILILQGQMRKALSPGITSDFMFYSVSYAHDLAGARTKKHKSHKDEVVKDALSSGDTSNNRHVAATSKKNAKTVDTSTVKNSSMADSDGDGIPDKDDKCPHIKGSRENTGCPFPPVDGADVVSMSADSVTYCIYFAYDQSELVGYDYSVLNRIEQIVQSDKTLTIHISGHADNQGTGLKNVPISADRAKVTVDYFRSYGIAASRITSSYYGSDRPLDKAQQWRNRRAEITIIKH